MTGRQDIVRYAITGAVVLLVLALRLRGMRGTRRLRLETLWVVPTIYLAFAIFLFAEMPPAGINWLWAALALIAGATLGWRRGKLMRISVDPETHALNQQASPAAMIFIIALMAVRFSIHSLIPAGGDPIHGGAALATDLLVAFALGLFSLTRLEMFVRARRLLAEARAARGPA